MRSIFLATSTYLKAYLEYILRLDTKHALAFEHLIHLKTHRITKGNHLNLKLSLGLLFNFVFRDIFRMSNRQVLTGDAYIYNSTVEKWAVEYLRNNGEEIKRPIWVIINGLRIQLSLFERLLYIFIVVFIILISLPLIALRPVGIWALHIKVFHEILSVVTNLRSNDAYKFYDLISYEIGSSFLNVILQKRGIKVYSITSPTPLYETYPDCVCDIFLSTSPYHLDEIEYGKVNNSYPLKFMFNEIRMWPYNTLDNELEYNNGMGYDNGKTIGLYVSGVWLRSKEQHQEFVDGFFDSEFKLIRDLKNFISAHPEFHLQLYLHPKERATEEILKSALEFYSETFGEIPFDVMDTSKPTKSQFSACDISISVSSNTTYERLYGGFKSIFAPYFLPNFPIPGNALEYLCVRDEKQLTAAILKFDRITDREFFENGGLWKYHYKQAKFDNTSILKGEHV